MIKITILPTETVKRLFLSPVHHSVRGSNFLALLPYSLYWDTKFKQFDATVEYRRNI